MDEQVGGERVVVAAGGRLVIRLGDGTGEARWDGGPLISQWTAVRLLAALAAVAPHHRRLSKAELAELCRIKEATVMATVSAINKAFVAVCRTELAIDWRSRRGYRLRVYTALDVAPAGADPAQVDDRLAELRPWLARPGRRGRRRARWAGGPQWNLQPQWNPQPWLTRGPVGPPAGRADEPPAGMLEALLLRRGGREIRVLVPDGDRPSIGDALLTHSLSDWSERLEGRRVAVAAGGAVATLLGSHGATAVTLRQAVTGTVEGLVANAVLVGPDHVKQVLGRLRLDPAGIVVIAVSEAAFRPVMRWMAAHEPLSWRRVAARTIPARVRVIVAPGPEWSEE